MADLVEENGVTVIFLLVSIKLETGLYVRRDKDVEDLKI